MDRGLLLNQEITNLQQDINNIKNHVDITNYLSKIGFTLLNYFNNNTPQQSESVINLSDIVNHQSSNNDDLVIRNLNNMSQKQKKLKKNVKKRAPPKPQSKTIFDFCKPFAAIISLTFPI